MFSPDSPGDSEHHCGISSDNSLPKAKDEFSPLPKFKPISVTILSSNRRRCNGRMHSSDTRWGRMRNCTFPAWKKTPSTSIETASVQPNEVPIKVMFVPPPVGPF